ncbi:MAG: NAD(P)H-dependent oxidoreductase [Rhodothermaceae bacterium]
MKNTLVILTHPDFDNSIANKTIVTNISQQTENVKVRHLDKIYPDFNIDIETEQNELLKADTIVFQFPFFWYSTPALLKHWIDKVFSFNFAYGPEGDKLKGKNFLLSFTVGGTEDAYKPTGYNHFYIEDFLKPFEQTAYLSGMIWNKPIFTNWMVYVPGVYNTKNEVIKRAEKHSLRLAEFINSKNKFFPENRIKEFISEWFSKFDMLEETGYFIRHIYPDAKFVFPEGEFVGHQGFADWYNKILNKFEAPVKHEISDIKITDMGNSKFNVSLNITLESKKKDGLPFSQKISENWNIVLQDEDLVKISEYKALAVN